MAYTPPVTFVTGTALAAADVQDNFDELRTYLHDNVVEPDLRLTVDKPWVETVHIQPPKIFPLHNLQHGVTGWQGCQWSGGVEVKATFMTSLLTGRTYASGVWARVPETSFKLSLRRKAYVFFHWTLEINAGPQNEAARGIANQDLYCYFAPYVGNPRVAIKNQGHEVQNNYHFFKMTNPCGAEQPYNITGYRQQSGVHYFEGDVGELTVGLAYYSEVAQAVVINWSVAIEAYYL